MRKLGNQKQSMLFLLAAMVCLLVMGGCGQKKPENAGQESSGETAVQTEETEAVQTESAQTTEAESAAPETTEAAKATESVETEPVPAETEAVQESTAVKLPDALPKEFVFSSGAGGWGTVMVVNPDGTFEGEYHDSEMGDMGEDYPDGTVYTSRFSGKFGDIQPVDAYSYSMTLEELHTEKPVGEEWIENKIRYVSSAPYGLENGKDFIFYMLDTPVEGLPEMFLSWWPMRFSADGDVPDTLTCYGIYNVEEEAGFFTYE